MGSAQATHDAAEGDLSKDRRKAATCAKHYHAQVENYLPSLLHALTDSSLASKATCISAKIVATVAGGSVASRIGRPITR